MARELFRSCLGLHVVAWRYIREFLEVMAWKFLGWQELRAASITARNSCRLML
jgi:hypothetical protein